MNKQLEKQADEAKRVSLWSIMVADREKSFEEIFYFLKIFYMFKTFQSLNVSK